MQIDDMDFALNLSLYLTRLTKKLLSLLHLNLALHERHFRGQNIGRIAESKIASKCYALLKYELRMTRCYRACEKSKTGHRALERP